MSTIIETDTAAVEASEAETLRVLGATFDAGGRPVLLLSSGTQDPETITVHATWGLVDARNAPRRLPTVGVGARLLEVRLPLPPDDVARVALTLDAKVAGKDVALDLSDVVGQLAAADSARLEVRADDVLVYAEQPRRGPRLAGLRRRLPPRVKVKLRQARDAARSVRNQGSGRG